MDRNERGIFHFLTSGAEAIEADPLDRAGDDLKKKHKILLSTAFAIDVGVNPDTQEPIYTSRVDRFVSNYARSEVCLDTAQYLHNRVITSNDSQSHAGREYEQLVALVLTQHGFQGKMEELGVPNPKTVELTIEPGGEWIQAGPGPWDRFITAVKVHTAGAKPVIAATFTSCFFPARLERSDRSIAGTLLPIQRLLKGLELKEEDTHIVQLVPESQLHTEKWEESVKGVARGGGEWKTLGERFQFFGGGIVAR